MFRFLLLIAISALIITINDVYIFNEEMLIQLFSKKQSEAELKNVVEKAEQWKWLRYALLPCVYFLKSLIVMLCLSAGLLAFNREIKFGNLFNIGVTAQFVTLLPSVIFIIWYSLSPDNYSLANIQNYSQLSLLSIYNSESLETWEKFVFRKINLFEPVFIGVLGHGLSQHYKQSISKSLKIVLASYGTGLSIWVLLVTFLLVTYS